MKHEFAFLNTTIRPLAITSINRSCACTTAAIDRVTIPPGGQAQLAVTATLGGLARTDRIMVVANTDDKQTPQISFGLSYKSVPKLEVKPLAVSLTESSFGTTNSVSIPVEFVAHTASVGNDGKADRFNVDLPQKGLGLRRLRSARDRVNYNIFMFTLIGIIDIERSFYEQNLGRKVSVPVRFAGLLATELAITMQAPSDIQVTPRALYFGVISPTNKEPKSLTFSIRLHDGDFDGLTFRDESTLVSIRLNDEESQSPSKFRTCTATLQIDRLPEPLEAQSINDEIVIQQAGITKVSLPWTAYLTK